MSAAHLKGPVVHFATRYGCTNKIRFETRREVASTIRRGTKFVGAEPYHCRLCDGWHITSGREWEGVGQR